MIVKIISLILISSLGTAATPKPTVNSKSEKTIARLAATRAAIQEQKLRLEADLAKKNGELGNLKKLITGDRKDIFQSIQFLRYVKNHSNQIIFQGIDSSSSLDRRQRLVEELTGHQVKLVTDKIQAVKEIQKTQEQVQKRLSQIAAREEKLQELEAKITNAYLERDRNSKNKNAMPTLRGKLDWPILFSKQQKKYGINLIGTSNLVFRNNGVYLATENGSPVSAIHKGEVIFTGLLEGFGPTVIVDHGDHFYSVYSGLKDVAVQIGDKIDKRQLLASTGLVENLDMPGIYFELRHYKEAIDPEPWMKGFSR